MCTMFSEMFLAMGLLSLMSWSCYVNADNASDAGKLYYFAYGSNLLAKRIHINNPTAVFYSSAKLENHRLDFDVYDEPWNGAGATIVEDEDEVVWGDLWVLNADQVHYLDEQEGVDLELYFAKNVTVTTPDGTKILARTYQKTASPEKTPKGEDIPPERRPSNTYLQVIVLGAIESKLPAEYIGFLISFPTNGQMASARRRSELGYPF